MLAEIKKFENKYYKGPIEIKGEKIFIKADPYLPSELFQAEAKGLNLLKESQSVKVPEVLAVGKNFIATKYINGFSAKESVAYDLGIQLAKLHKNKAEFFGTSWPLFIGSIELPQLIVYSWQDYQEKIRLYPLFKTISSQKLLGKKELDLFNTLLENLAKIPHPAKAALVHGDLWGGNIIWTNSNAYLIDPSAHYGDPMCDIAMMQIFCPNFIDLILKGYVEIAGPFDEFKADIELNKTFYLAVHLILFGSSYEASLMRSIKNALRI